MMAVVAAGLLLVACGVEPESGGINAGTSLPGGAPPTRFVSIVTGGISGIYYPAGGAVAAAVNASRERHGLRMIVEASDGSVANVDAVMEGRAAFGIVQSDRQFQAYHGFAEWQERGPRSTLRSVFSLHSENVVLVAAVDTGIRRLSDLTGKRVNVGNRRSGHRRNALDALAANGIDPQLDFAALSEHTVERAPSLLQQGKIDAFFYTVGHPNEALRSATAGTRRVAFIPIDNILDILKSHPYYSRSSIPLHYYPRVQRKKGRTIRTFGVRATLVTALEVPDEVVYAVVKTVLEKLDWIKTRHPALADLQQETLLRNLSAPLHPGARRYYEEMGML